MRCWRCCTAIAKRRSFNAASAGRRDRRRSGTIAARSTTRCGTISRSAATATASGQGRPPVLTGRQLPPTLSLSPSNGERERSFSARTKSALSPHEDRGWGEGLLQVLAEVGLDVAPQFLRRRFAVARPVIGEEGVTGVLVDLCRDVLTGRLGALLELGFERDRRVLGIFAEYAEKRAM